jgi:hypothetical protein
MKKYMMKGVALLGVAILTVSCSHDAWFQTNDATQRDAEEYASNFKNIVMGGQNVDSRQTWNTAVTTQINLTSAKTGTLKIYTADPGRGSAVAALYTGSVSKGEKKSITVARPQDATTLYATVLDANGYMIDNIAFDASESEVTAAFYTTPAEARQAKAARRAIKSVFNFPQDADASKFLDDVPAGVLPYDQVQQWGGYGTGVSYIENRSEEVNIWGAWDGSKNSGGILYVKGNCDFTNCKFYVAQNTEIFLVRGATLTLGTQGSTDLQGGCNIYIAEGATLKTADGLELVGNNGLHFYNHGTIEAGKLQINNASVLYNTATITVNGELSTENSNSVIVNDGTITATRLHTAGSSHVQNNGTMFINGNTDIDSNDNTWVNNGHYTTENFIFTAGSSDVINNCYLTVKNLFEIAIRDGEDEGFRMDSNAGVVTKFFKMNGPSYIRMGAQSVFEVTEIATMIITKPDYGIYGPQTGDYAVFHAKKIVSGVADPNQCFVANYFQKLIVAYDESHFPQGYSDGESDAAKANGGIGWQPYYHIGDGAIVDKTEFINYTVESSNCNPGFNGAGGNKEELKQYTYFAFEDLGTSDDFDFNDVVVRVSTPDENNVSTVELCAIGGTLKQKVFCDNIQIGEEVHEYGEFGDNTKRFIKVPLAELGTVNVPQGKSPADLNINIQVTRSSGEIVTVGGPKAGETPFRVIVSGNDEGKWFWAKERTNISDAYTLFGKWGADMDSNPDWYKSPVKGQVIEW